MIYTFSSYNQIWDEYLAYFKFSFEDCREPMAYEDEEFLVARS